MIKIFKLLILFFFIIACGFDPIFSGKKVDFGIKNLRYDQTKIIEVLINNNLNNYKKIENKSKIYELEISSKKNKITTAKDERGAPKSFRMEIFVYLKVLKNNQILYSNEFYKSQDYNNDDNKFNLKKYEKTMNENLANKISEEILIYILSL